jgi:hypothetical protein
MTGPWVRFCQKNSRKARLNSDAADTPKGFAGSRLPQQGNRKRKGAPLIKAMRLFLKEEAWFGGTRTFRYEQNCPKYSKSPQMIA